MSCPVSPKEKTYVGNIKSIYKKRPIVLNDEVFTPCSLTAKSGTFCKNLSVCCGCLNSDCIKPYNLSEPITLNGNVVITGTLTVENISGNPTFTEMINFNGGANFGNSMVIAKNFSSTDGQFMFDGEPNFTVSPDSLRNLKSEQFTESNNGNRISLSYYINTKIYNKIWTVINFNEISETNLLNVVNEEIFLSKYINFDSRMLFNVILEINCDYDLLDDNSMLIFQLFSENEILGSKNTNIIPASKNNIFNFDFIINVNSSNTIKSRVFLSDKNNSDIIINSIKIDVVCL